MRIGIPNQISKIHPFESTTAQQDFILPLIYESLIINEINGDTKPNLIKDWRVDERERSFTFKIRNDVRFSDGSLLILNDVLNSFKLACRHPLKSKDLSMIKGCAPQSKVKLGIELNGDEVKIYVTTHPSYLFSVLAGENILIVKKVNNQFIGTGPFKIKELNNDSLILEKNALNKFWSNGSQFNQLQFIFIDEGQLKNTIQKKKLHLFSMFLTSSMSQFLDKGYVTINHAPNVVQAIALNSKVHPFNNHKLRNAIHYRLKQISFDQCILGARKTNGFIPKGVGGSFDSNELNFSIPKIQDLKLKFPFKVTFPRHVGRKNLCEENLIQKVFKEFNIDLVYEYHQNYDTLDPAVLNPKVPGFQELFVFKSRDASSHLKNMIPGNPQNFYLFESPLIKSILEDAWNAKDLRSRFNFYKKANRVIWDNSILIDLYAIGHSNRIHKCLLPKKHDVSYYNPNSFLFLLQLDFNSNCNLGK